MAIKEGWKGRVYEDFEVGDIYPHPLGRTVTTADNIWFTMMTQNTNPIHFDHVYAAKTEFKRTLMNSTFTLALVTGQSVTDLLTCLPHQLIAHHVRVGPVSLKRRAARRPPRSRTPGACPGPKRFSGKC